MHCSFKDDASEAASASSPLKDQKCYELFGHCDDLRSFMEAYKKQQELEAQHDLKDVCWQNKAVVAPLVACIMFSIGVATGRCL
eukprot:symbB.v1.2.029589.t1/scaffold3258.1/size60114/2